MFVDNPRLSLMRSRCLACVLRETQLDSITLELQFDSNRPEVDLTAATALELLPGLSRLEPALSSYQSSRCPLIAKLSLPELPSAVRQSSIMPPHLHPRSTATSTLFAGTLLASFIVVGIPHVFPCPRPRTGYAQDAGQIHYDKDGNPLPRNAKQLHQATNVDIKDTRKQIDAPKPTQKTLTGSKELDDEAALFRELAAEAEMLDKKAILARECPVPKPAGLIGRILGFDERSTAPVKDGSDKG